ncbi:MAG: DNA polymerase III subunit delta [Alphaproteobacteria bacterium]
MVAFKAAQAASFIASPQTRFIAALVYGPEASLVSERARQLAVTLAGSQEPLAEIIRIDDKDLADNPDVLGNELQMQSMFAERRIVHLRAERRTRPELLKELLGGELSAYLIVEAGNLRPTSPLRKLFEASERTVALPCYSDPARDMAPLITSVLSSHGVSISGDARSHLLSRLGSDVALARSEITKLATYTGKDAQITVEDIDAIIGDMGAGVLDTLAMATADGKTGEALKNLDSLIAGGQSPHSALAALSRHFQRLHRLCAAIEAGEPAKAAMTKLRPPVHFKQQGALIAQSRKWSRAAASRALRQVQNATRATRTNTGLDHQMTERLLIVLSRSTS